MLQQLRKTNLEFKKLNIQTPYDSGFLGDSAGQEYTCNAGDLGLICGLGRSPGEGKGFSLQYSGLENSMDCIVYGITKSQTQRSNFHNIHICTYIHAHTYTYTHIYFMYCTFKKCRGNIQTHTYICAYTFAHACTVRVYFFPYTS